MKLTPPGNQLQCSTITVTEWPDFPSSWSVTTTWPARAAPPPAHSPLIPPRTKSSAASILAREQSTITVVKVEQVKIRRTYRCRLLTALLLPWACPMPSRVVETSPAAAASSGHVPRHRRTRHQERVQRHQEVAADVDGADGSSYSAGSSSTWPWAPYTQLVRAALPLWLAAGSWEVCRLIIGLSRSKGASRVTNLRGRAVSFLMSYSSGNQILLVERKGSHYVIGGWTYESVLLLGFFVLSWI